MAKQNSNPNKTNKAVDTSEKKKDENDTRWKLLSKISSIVVIAFIPFVAFITPYVLDWHEKPLMFENARLKEEIQICRDKDYLYWQKKYKDLKKENVRISEELLQKIADEKLRTILMDWQHVNADKAIDFESQ